MEKGTALARLTAYLEGQPLPAEHLAHLLIAGERRQCRALEGRLCLDRTRDQTLGALIDEARAELEVAGRQSC